MFPGGCRVWYGTKLTWVSPSGASEHSGSIDNRHLRSWLPAGRWGLHPGSQQLQIATAGMNLDVFTAAIAGALLIRLEVGPPGPSLAVGPHRFKPQSKTMQQKSLWNSWFAVRNAPEDRCLFNGSRPVYTPGIRETGSGGEPLDTTTSATGRVSARRSDDTEARNCQREQATGTSNV
jgi:hypothetical protein